MKTTLLIGLSSLAFLQGCGSKPAPPPVNGTVTTLVADVGCGQCQLGLKGKPGCDLAIRIDGKSYFVDGVKMNDLGDPHEADGLCSVVHPAKVTGELKDGRFAASSVKLQPKELK